MTAKEMFEELGYKLSKVKEDETGFIVKRYSKGGWLIIDFYLEHEQFVCKDKNNEAFGVDMKELKAINKQVEELNWNKEE